MNCKIIKIIFLAISAAPVVRSTHKACYTLGIVYPSLSYHIFNMPNTELFSFVVSAAMNLTKMFFYYRSSNSTDDPRIKIAWLVFGITGFIASIFIIFTKIVSPIKIIFCAIPMSIQIIELTQFILDLSNGQYTLSAEVTNILHFAAIILRQFFSLYSISIYFYPGIPKIKWILDVIISVLTTIILLFPDKLKLTNIKSGSQEAASTTQDSDHQESAIISYWDELYNILKECQRNQEITQPNWDEIMHLIPLVSAQCERCTNDSILRQLGLLEVGPTSKVIFISDGLQVIQSGVVNGGLIFLGNRGLQEEGSIGLQEEGSIGLQEEVSIGLQAEESPHQTSFATSPDSPYKKSQLLFDTLCECHKSGQITPDQLESIKTLAPNAQRECGSAITVNQWANLDVLSSGSITRVNEGVVQSYKFRIMSLLSDLYIAKICKPKAEHMSLFINYDDLQNIGLQKAGSPHQTSFATSPDSPYKKSQLLFDILCEFLKGVISQNKLGIIKALATDAKSECGSAITEDQWANLDRLSPGSITRANEGGVRSYRFYIMSLLVDLYIKKICKPKEEHMSLFINYDYLDTDTKNFQASCELFDILCLCIENKQITEYQLNIINQLYYLVEIECASYSKKYLKNVELLKAGGIDILIPNQQESKAQEYLINQILGDLSDVVKYPLHRTLAIVLEQCLCEEEISEQKLQLINDLTNYATNDTREANSQLREVNFALEGLKQLKSGSVQVMIKKGEHTESQAITIMTIVASIKVLVGINPEKAYTGKFPSASSLRGLLHKYLVKDRIPYCLEEIKRMIQEAKKELSDPSDTLLGELDSLQAGFLINTGQTDVINRAMQYLDYKINLSVE